jgi:hypothetical protein
VEQTTTTTKETMRHKQLPELSFLEECFELSDDSPSGIQWKKERPSSHFKTLRGWRIWSSQFAGKHAGNIHSPGNGYKHWEVRLAGSLYKAHRLVYMLANKVDPSDLEVDHIDGDATNNRPNNLRLANHIENGHNRSKNRNNKSGHKGVSWYKNLRKWVAEIMVDGKRKRLGCFDQLEDAANAYKEQSLLLHKTFSPFATANINA